MPRLDQQRQIIEEPKRMAYAKQRIEAKGYEVSEVYNRQLTFEFNGEKVHFFPYSGWATGKTIKDGRGLEKLLSQI